MRANLIEIFMEKKRRLLPPVSDALRYRSAIAILLITDDWAFAVTDNWLFPLAKNPPVIHNVGV